MLIVRLAHLLAMTIVTGGAILVWGVVETGARRDVDGETLGVLCAIYEWLFWGAAGVLVMTGVGNLGALGRGLPGVETEWGFVLAVKLTLVLLVLAFSAVRTLVVSVGSTVRTLRVAYGATVLGLLVVVTLAEVLAHG